MTTSEMARHGRLTGRWSWTRALGALVAIVAVAAAAACGGDSPTGTGGGGGGGGGSDFTLRVTRAELDSLAIDLYVRAAAGADVTPQVTTILGAIMPIVADGQERYADSLLSTGTPLALPQQPALIASAMADQEAIPVDSFVSAAASAGATAAGGSQPLTPGYLTSIMSPIAADTVYGLDDIVPGVVLALGRARAMLEGTAAADPVWGDGRLDPLQTTLLLYVMSYGGVSAGAASRLASPASAAASTSRSADLIAVPDAAAREAETFEGWVAEKAKDKVLEAVTGKIGEEIDFPLDKKEAAEASLCASVLLYSYKFKVSASPVLVWHHDPNQPDHPWKTLVTAQLFFDFTPNAIGSAVLPLIDCPIPDAGPAPAHNVGWSLDDTLKEHGSLDLQQNVTDDNGVAVASYVTIPEVVPTPLQLDLPKISSGSVGIIATGILPGKWANLEKAVGLGVWSPSESGAEVHVQYYEVPKGVEVQIHSSMNGDEGAALWNGVADADLQAGKGTLPVLFSGGGPATYETFYYKSKTDLCPLESTGTENGQLKIEVSANASRPGGVSTIFDLGSPYPQEDYQVVCNGQTTTTKGSRFWGWFFVIHGDSLLSGVKPVAPGHGQRIYSGTWSSSGVTITEQTTVDVYLATQ